MQDDRFIKYNKLLGKQASIGPIAADQIIPWMAIILLSYLVTNGLFSFGLLWFFGVAFWLIVSWTLIAGDKPHKFTDQWRRPPGRDWYNARIRYVSPVSEFRSPNSSMGSMPMRIRAKPLTVPNPDRGKSRFMPFQNEVNLCCIAELKVEDREAAAFLLEKGKDEYQVVFAFHVEGLHDILHASEVEETALAIEAAMKDLPPGEKITFSTSCTSDDRNRQQELEQLADGCNLMPISVLLRNEQVKVAELSDRGVRQRWQQIAFCTWTSNAKGNSKQSDWLSKALDGLFDVGAIALNMLTGNQRVYRESFFKHLLLKSFHEGFLPWELLLSTKAGLTVRPYSQAELWQWLYGRFNPGTAPPTPQVLTLTETKTGFHLDEQRTTEKHAVTVLIEGMNGRSSCPRHYERTDLVSIEGRQQKCGVLTMEEAPGGWSSLRDQLKWTWKILSASYVHNTEAWIEISRGNDFLIQDNLARQARQSKTARIRATTQGQGRDVGAEIKQEESFDAQRRLYQGQKGLHCGVAFLVYRPNAEELTIACNTLCSGFDSAKVLREPNIAWEIWLQTLPITTRWLLHDNNLFSERRLMPDSHTIAGFLPLTVPKPIDSAGVEFLSERGGKPIYIDLFRHSADRALITGMSGSGKSVLAWRFMIDALALNIPIVGMDMSASGGSTFRTAIELLGDDAAYFDIRQGSSNLMEPPDLRKFNKEERLERMNTWKDFIRSALLAIALGSDLKVHSALLSQRINSILIRTLDLYLKDADIKARYNEAFRQGWKSTAWQMMPTLLDFARFCTRERLNLRNLEDIDRAAIGQIQSQIEALSKSSLGPAICRPSSFSPDPAVKFFALSNLSNEQDSYLMAISAHTACMRNALSHPQSFFVGDELSVLLKKNGFAQMVGETCATGRKEGISVLLISQDPDSICECSSGAQIMQNINYRITGSITAAAAASFQKFLGYHSSLIDRNTTEAYLPRTSELLSHWLIERNQRFWRVNYHPGEMALASVANAQDEAAARDRIFAAYDTDAISRLRALKAFTDLYIPATQAGRGYRQIQPAASQRDRAAA